MSLRYCPAGRHPMDPGWEVCPYCASESAPRPVRDDATRRSVPEGELAQIAVAGAVPRTVFAEEAPRRIVGVIATYTWRPEGEVFFVREGSNLVGSAPECEIRITSDPRISGRHACIVHRPGGFWIDDENSMNGTFVDGALIEDKQRLPDTAVLRTGGTLWRFTALEPPPEDLGPLPEN